MVERHDHELTLSTKGRKIEERIFHFGFQYDEPTHTWAWTFEGEGPLVVSGSRTRFILQAFANARTAGQFELDARGVIDFAEAEHTQALYNSVRQALFQLRRKGILIRARNGLFVVANPGDLPPPIDDPGMVI
jgi:hypothetical protein